MKSKPGAAMVEMGDCYAVDRVLSHLNNNMLFGQKLNVWCVYIGIVFECAFSLYIDFNMHFYFAFCS